MLNNVNKRQRHIDAISGLLIINMILGHCIQMADCRDIPLYSWMDSLSFFMPWFFFKSGMFYREKSLNETIHGGAKIIKPYLKWNLIGYIPFVLLLMAQYDNVWYHYCLQPFKGILLNAQYSGNAPLWFLPVLFVVKCLFVRLKKIPWIVILIVSFSIGYTFYVLKLKEPTYIASIFTGLFFYTMGHLLSSFQYKNILFFISIIMYFVFVVVGVSFVDINSNTLKCGNYLLWPLFAISGIICFDNIFRYIDCFFKKWSVLHYIGNNSMTFYVSHWVVLNMGMLIFKNLFEMEKYDVLCCNIVLCIICLPIISKFNK